MMAVNVNNSAQNRKQDPYLEYSIKAISEVNIKAIFKGLYKFKT